MDDGATGALDVPTLGVLGRWAASHPLVVRWRFEPGDRSPRRVALDIDDAAYPAAVTAVRVDVRWFETGDYTFHYREHRGDGSTGAAWECRWDRHPKTAAPREHFHPPPDAGVARPSNLDADHHLDALFAVLDGVEERVADLHGRS